MSPLELKQQQIEKLKDSLQFAMRKNGELKTQISLLQDQLLKDRDTVIGAVPLLFKPHNSKQSKFWVGNFISFRTKDTSIKFFAVVIRVDEESVRAVITGPFLHNHIYDIPKSCVRKPFWKALIRTFIFN